jgi:hypothetical protein
MRKFLTCECARAGCFRPYFFVLSMPTANRRRCDHPLNPGGPLRRPPRQHREHSAFRSDLPNTVVTALIRLMNCLPRSALRPVLSCNGVLDSIDAERSLPRVQPPPCHDSAREPDQAASWVMSVAQAWFGRSIVDPAQRIWLDAMTWRRFDEAPLLHEGAICASAFN